MIEFGKVTATRIGTNGYLEANVQTRLGINLWLTVIAWNGFEWEPQIGQVVAYSTERRNTGVVLGSPVKKKLSTSSTPKIARVGDTVQVTTDTGTWSGAITTGSSNGKLL